MSRDKATTSSSIRFRSPVVSVALAAMLTISLSAGWTSNGPSWAGPGPGAPTGQPPMRSVTAPVIPDPVTFGASRQTIVTEPKVVATGDLNHDGKQDVVTSYFDPVVSLGNGDGTFQTPVTYPASGGAYALALADVNGDGNLDIVTGGGSVVGVQMGRGDGTFGSVITTSVPGTVSAVAAADVNADGKVDLVVSMGMLSEIGVMLGNGDGTFQAPVTYATHGDAEAVIITDLSGDGKPDIATADGTPPGADPATASVFLNLGAGTFTGANQYRIGSTYAVAHSIAAANGTGNGRPDLVVADQNCGFDGGDTVVLPNLGGGSFGTAQSLQDACTDSVATGDFNGTRPRQLG